MKEERDLAQKVQEICLRRGWSIAVAESCTGGLLGGSLTALAGSSEYFFGGVIAYSNDLKISLLNIPAALLDSEGAVSMPVVEAMAQGVAAVTNADCGISVTGVAGPSGGTRDKPVGTVWVAVTLPSGTVSRLFTFSGDRDRIRNLSVEAALALFLETAG